MASAQSPVQPTNAAAGYFVDQKKGEVNELKLLLKNINVERDTKKKRDIIKKVIAYMTLGIDVSRLFTDMIMAIETKDIVVKKMVYLYLCNYAHKEPDMALMCINTLRRDCDNEDPMVRGLALRSLCNLRLESILEYVGRPLQKSLTDLSAYVRKTGVMGILKLHYLCTTFVETNGYMQQLHSMLKDTDATVVTNAIMVINELMIAQGGMEVTQSVIMALLNRIGEFSEWGLNTILGLLCRYTPASEDETFAIMNLLDPVLRTANSGAVLATFKCFMKLTANHPDMQPQVYQRTKPPILTLITGGHSEVQYTMLKHLHVILHRTAARGVFDDEYRQFFVRYSEPPYVKHLKVDLLPLIANNVNARDIATELGEYVTDVDAELSKRAIAALAEIAMRVQSVALDMTQTLIDLIDMDMPYVRAEAMKSIANVMRLFPAAKDIVLPALARCMRRVEDPEAKASLIWIIGEYGQLVTEAPYMLEPIIDNYEEESSSHVKLQVLTAAMKLFFKRPPEMQAMLGRLMSFAVNDSANQDVHDRALLYYRLLSANVNVASALFASGDANVGNGTDFIGFAEHRDLEKNNQIFAEFNTLSVVYDMPSSQFIADAMQFKYENAPMSDFNPTIAISSIAPPGAVGSLPPVAEVSRAAVPVVQQSVNLLDWGDDTSTSTSHTHHSHAAPALPLPLLLKDSLDMTPQRFQQLWGTLSDSFSGVLCVLQLAPGGIAVVENLLRQSKVAVMASGPLPPPAANAPSPGLKMFVYAGEGDDLLSGAEGAVYLMQMLVLLSGEVSVTVKTTSNQSARATQLMRDYLTQCTFASLSPRVA